MMDNKYKSVYKTDLEKFVFANAEILGQKTKFAIDKAGLTPLLYPPLLFKNKCHFLLQCEERFGVPVFCISGSTIGLSKSSEHFRIKLSQLVVDVSQSDDADQLLHSRERCLNCIQTSLALLASFSRAVDCDLATVRTKQDGAIDALDDGNLILRSRDLKLAKGLGK